MKIVHEKDNGQHTTNVHIIAKRHILSGVFTNVTIINTVLDLSLTQQELDNITSIRPLECYLCNDIEQTRLTIQNIVGKIINVIPYIFRKAGVYVFTNLRTGEQYVGSSLNLADRLISYFTSKSLSQGIRLIFVDFRKFHFSDYRLQIYIIQDRYDSTPKEKLFIITLALEEYLIFTLNSTLNTIKVAGAPPFHHIISSATKAMIQKLNKIVYVYIDNVLIFQCSSGVMLKSIVNISTSSITKGLNGALIYGILKFSRIKYHDYIENLLTSSEFTELVFNLRLKSKKKNSIVNLGTQRNHNNKIAVQANNILTDQVHNAPSVIEISKLLTTLGYFVSESTIRRDLLNGKTWKCWTFSKIKKDSKNTIQPTHCNKLSAYFCTTNKSRNCNMIYPK